MTKIKPIQGMTTPRFADIATFFRLPIVKDLNQIDYCICGIPWDGGTTNRPGARHGPREVRNASSLIRLYHPVSLKSPYDYYNVADIGDCPVNPADLQDSLNKIENFLLSYWNGEQKLWKAFWLMGFVFQILFLYFLLVLLYFGVLIGLTWSIKVTIFLLSNIYQIWILVSIWNCAYNVRNKTWGHLSRSIVILNVIFIILTYTGIVSFDYQNIIQKNS